MGFAKRKRGEAAAGKKKRWRNERFGAKKGMKQRRRGREIEKEEGGRESGEEAVLRNSPVCCHGAGSVRAAQ